MSRRNSFIYDIAVTALFAAVIVICSWVTVPVGAVPFTLQTFGVLCAAGVLGLKRGLAAVAVYILLGAVGLPVFHGFQGGVGVLMGSTGGYIFGFLLTAGAVGLLAERKGRSLVTLLLSMTVGVVLCYAVGVLWYVLVYNGGSGVGSVLLTTVAPFLVPDALKIFAAAAVVNRVAKYVK